MTVNVALCCLRPGKTSPITMTRVQGGLFHGKLESTGVYGMIIDISYADGAPRRRRQLTVCAPSDIVLGVFVGTFPAPHQKPRSEG